jgi:hypothetical protein
MYTINYSLHAIELRYTEIQKDYAKNPFKSDKKQLLLKTFNLFRLKS